MDIKHLIFDSLNSLIRNKYGLDYSPSVDRPIDQRFGDYTSNCAMQLAKILKKSPQAIADELISEISIPEIDSVRFVSPGFINFYVKKGIFAGEILKKYLEEGSIKVTEPKKEKIIIEHTSVNPNKAMHIGHLRNACIGDSIVRLLRKMGNDVEVQNYIDDTGLQVADTTNAVLHLNQKYDPSKDGEFDDYAWNLYTEINKRYLTDPALDSTRKDLLEEIEKGIGVVAKTSSEVVEKILECHLSQLEKLDIKYDFLAYESDIIKSDLWTKCFEELKKSSNFVLETEGKNKGCWVLKHDGDGGDKVFVRANGSKVYTAKDTAYNMWKFGIIKTNFSARKSQYDSVHYEIWRSSVGENPSKKFGNGKKIITVVDERQSYPLEMVKLALKSLGYEKESQNYIHLAYGVVNLSNNTAQQLGIEVKDDQSTYAMSGRKGIGVKSKDLISKLVTKIQTEKLGDKKNVDAWKIAEGAVKFYMLKNHFKSPVIFDMEEALNVEGFTGPYIQYSFARANKVLQKSGGFNIEYVPTYELEEYEYKLVNKLSDYADILNSVSENLNIAYIAEYLFALASDFSSFYQNTPILKGDDAKKDFRLSLVKAYTRVLADGMEIMGIPVMEEM